MPRRRLMAALIGAWLVLCGGLARAGLIQAPGFKMPTGAQNGYVLTCDGSGVGTWQLLPGGGVGPHTHFGETWSGSSSGAGLSVTNSNASGRGIYGCNSASNAQGVLGYGQADIGGSTYTFGLHTPNDLFVGGSIVSDTVHVTDSADRRRIGIATVIPYTLTPFGSVTINGMFIADSAGRPLVAIGEELGSHDSVVALIDSAGVVRTDIYRGGLGVSSNAGTWVGSLDADSDGGSLDLSNNAGGDRVWLSIHQDTGYLKLFDTNGNDGTTLWGDGKAFFDGDVSAGGDVTAGGDFFAVGDISCGGVKAFVQQHPEDPKKEIVYVALEGPEAATYVRGTAEVRHGEARVELPEHFALVTCKEGLTVQLTPVGQWLQLYVVEKTPRLLVIRGASDKSGRFDYFVQGVRKGYEDHQVIRERSPRPEPAKLMRLSGRRRRTALSASQGTLPQAAKPAGD